MSKIEPISNEMRKQYINTRNLYTNWREAQHKLKQNYSGSLTWKNVNKTDYLVRLLDRKGTQRSLGPRSERTENIYKTFIDAKSNLTDRCKHLQSKLIEQAKYNKFYGIGRMPLHTAKILRGLDKAGLLGKGINVVGTNALYAYEAYAGVVITDDLMTTQDLDIMLDARSRLVIYAPQNKHTSILSILQKLDKSFTKNEGSYQAVNSDGFSVDLIKAEPSPPWRNEANSITTDDLNAVDITNLKWLLNAPTLETIGIDEKGLPYPIITPDPWAFAIYKLWLGTEAIGRDPIKRPRDKEQSIAVAKILAEHLPMHQYDPESMTMFPNSLVTSMRKIIDSTPEQDNDFDTFSP